MGVKSLLIGMAAAIVLDAGNRHAWAEPAPLDVSAEAVAGWIRELDDDDYHVREHASRQLAKAGATAVEPLASAAVSGGPEVVCRSVTALSELAISGNPPVEEGAEAALERLAEDKKTSAAMRATTALEYHYQARQERAVKAIEALGGTVTESGFGRPAGLALIVHLGADWQGGDAGLAHLKRVRDLAAVSLHGTPLTDDALKHLAPLQSLESLQIYGTDLSDSAVRQLAKSLPNVVIDRRAGGLLGVSGSSGEGIGCSVIIVQPGSAAEKAGLQPGDVITAFAGKKVADFPELTSLVSGRKGGETVAIEIVRQGVSATKQVQLGQWR